MSQTHPESLTMKLTLFAALVCLATLACAQDIGKCQLASTLVRLGVSRGEVHHWVCMADAESNRRYSIEGPRNRDGSSDYGIFQINSYWNCDPQDGRRTKNGCRKPCSSFLDTNLADDVQCIKQLLREHRSRGGFSSFSAGYKAKCSNVSSSYLSGCSF